MRATHAIELAVEELEARAAASVGEWLRGQWRAHLDGARLGPRWPAWLAGAELRARLARWRERLAAGAGAEEGDEAGVLARRVEMLRRVVVKGAVEEHPAVVEAARRAAAGGERGEAGVRELLDARNRAAREMGWAGFVEMIGEVEEIDEGVVAEAEAEAETEVEAEAETEVETETEAEAELAAAWPALASEGVSVGGEGSGVRADVGGGTARTYVIEAGRDVRVVVPARVRRRVVRHELGHAVYGMGVDAGLPWSLARAPARCLEEAVAELVAGIGDDGVRARGGWRRWQVARTKLERAAYRDPFGELERRWVELARAHVGHEPRRRWYEIDHLRTDPGSQASYLVGEVLRRRLAEALGWPGRAAARRLLEVVIRPGASVGWRELLARAGAAAL